jgi:hypothetical protein
MTVNLKKRQYEHFDIDFDDGALGSSTLRNVEQSSEVLDRVINAFQAIGTVTQSLRQGIPVDVKVNDSTGVYLLR